MELYKHKSYEYYVKEQTKTNKKKLDRISAEEIVLSTIADYIKENIPDAQFGICHGTRNGWEIEKFRELLDVEIFGTEISDTATQFGHTIQWDFHEVKEEWLDNIDFIYSNSLDHSYDPEHCISQWIKCIEPKSGRCFVEWSLMCETPKKGLDAMKADCFGASLDEYRDTLSRVAVIETELKISLKTEWVEKRGLKDDRVVFVLRRKT